MEHSGFVVMHIESTLEKAQKREERLKKIGYQTRIVKRRSTRFKNGTFVSFVEYRVLAEWVRVL